MKQYTEEKDNRFYIYKSKETNGGNGLYASCNLKKGDFLEIIGVIAKNEETKRCIDYTKNYVFMTKEGEWLAPTGYGGIVNHASNPSNQNAKITYIEDMVAYKFTRDIAKGEEILGCYGYSFANVLAIYNLFEGDGDIGHWTSKCELHGIKNRKYWKKLEKYNIKSLRFLNT